MTTLPRNTYFMSMSLILKQQEELSWEQGGLTTEQTYG